MSLRKEELLCKIIDLGIELDENAKWDNTKLIKKLGDYTLSKMDKVSWGKQFIQSMETVQLCKHMKDEIKNFEVSPLESEDFVAEYKLNGCRCKIFYDPDESFSFFSRKESVETFLNTEFTNKIYLIKDGIVKEPQDYKHVFPLRFALDCEITVEGDTEFEGQTYENVEDYLQAVLGSLPARAKSFQLNGHRLRFTIFDVTYFEKNPQGAPPQYKFDYTDKELTKEDIEWVESHFERFLTACGHKTKKSKAIPKLLYKYLISLKDTPKYDIRKFPFYKRRGIRKALVKFLNNNGLPFYEVEGEDVYKTEYLHSVLNNGGEGILVKSLDAPYISALKSSRSHKACMKVKQSITELMKDSNKFEDFDVFITGVNPPKSDRIKDMIGSLSCSIYLKDELGNTEIHEVANVSGISHEWKRKLAKVNEDGSIVLNPEYLDKVIAVDGMALSHSSLRFQHAKLKGEDLVFKDKNPTDCVWDKAELEKMIIVRGY